jgi:hypothetical protein
MKKPKYTLDKSGDFTIENYNYAKAFSNFFPGIAGLYGIPMWVFFVNRGQCIASFGTKDKDGSILEFYPANQAYNITSVKGFRTFIKVDSAKQRSYEPFRDNVCPYGKYVRNKMAINAHSLKLEEENPDLGLRVKVTYMTVPQEPYAGLARCLELTNISKKNLKGSLLDGLPHITPYGMNAWHQKHMSRTIEAWIRVVNVDKKIPFYALKVNPEDKPELEHFDKGNFYLAYLLSKQAPRLLDVIVDPDTVFGKGGDICFPRIFGNAKKFQVPGTQLCEGKTPSAFTYSPFSIKPGESIKIVSIVGNADVPDRINRRARTIMKSDFFGQKLKTNKNIIDRLESGIFTKSGSNEFDFYARQTFLDNLLRGGFPYLINRSNGPLVFYLYGRKHGDLERDYNNFSLLPSYFSQGNGAYRDMNQNRRSDIFFNPNVTEDNIKTFINALQLDGFNPLQINGAVFHIQKRKTLDQVLKRHLIGNDEREDVKGVLRKSFTPGELILYLDGKNIKLKKGRETFLDDILSISYKEDLLSPGEGYWVDHWTYNLDLVENYLALYPERAKGILINKKICTFFDTWNRVVPRSEKYVYVNGKIRQYGSVVEDEAKREMILSRNHEQYKVRAKHGKGHVYKTTLFVKLLNLLVNKMASLDPSGIGIEMEANKPGWCDAFNNLPGIFGSSTSETAELKRLVIFMDDAIEKLGLSANFSFQVSEEMAGFIKGLLALLVQDANIYSKNKDLKYWDKAAALKEDYRSRVWSGLSGKERKVTIKDLRNLLCLCSQKLDGALLKSVDKKTGIPHTYLFHEVTRYEFIRSRKEKTLNPKGYPLVKALSFKNTFIPYSLEAPVHLMKVLDNADERRRLYDAVRKSELYDKKLKMYRVNVSFEGMPHELGRSMVFLPGWLENESIWLHMEYKYLLELLQGGLYDEFFRDIKTSLVPFMNPEIYGRSILENSSFIASSVHPDKDIHGAGFAARLSGSTTEFLSIWHNMAVGKTPFRLDEKGRLIMAFEPALPEWLFTQQRSKGRFYFNKNSSSSVIIPKDSFAFAFLGKILVTYHNPKRKNTYGKDKVKPEWIILKSEGKRDVELSGGTVPTKYAESIREGRFTQVEIHLG